jgi:hypothetical protein
MCTFHSIHVGVQALACPLRFFPGGKAKPMPNGLKASAQTA